MGNSHLEPDEVTPESLYLSRRKFIVSSGAVLAAAFLASCNNKPSFITPPNAYTFCDDAKAIGAKDELGAQLTTCDYITHYNNYYEFSLSKENVFEFTDLLKMSPWSVTVGGLVENPGKFNVDELITKYKPEERIYRMRCVEGWSMVIPWNGFPLSRLLNDVKPKPEAKYVKFQTLLDPKQMPSQSDDSWPWPYVEGLRLDEAMHDLTLLTTGLYNKPLPPQDGGPIRLVVPWKYGFKNIKSIIKIDLVAEMPVSFWTTLAPNEYGFYANVNPDVPHPRWSQASERRIGELARRETLLFNGYNQVAPLYQGMDLNRDF